MKTRSFTDITCSAVYAVFLAAWIAVACTAFASGDYKRLILPKGLYQLLLHLGRDIVQIHSTKFVDMMKLLKTNHMYYISIH